MVVFHVIAVRVTVVFIFVDVEWVLGLVPVAVVLVVVPLTVAVVLVIVSLKSWWAYVGDLLLHVVPCLGLPVSTGRFVVGCVFCCFLLHRICHLLLLH